MQINKEKTLVECLQIIVRSIDLVCDRFDITTDRLEQAAERYEQLFTRSAQFFSDMRAEFLRGIITAEVNKYREQHNLTETGRHDGGKGVSGKKIHFTINAGCQGNDQEMAAHKR